MGNSGGGPPGYFRAVALDYDGTLAEGSVSTRVLAALDTARDRGLKIVLVTGRIYAELLEVFPGVERHVDAVVAENGAVLVCGLWHRSLSPPVAFALSEALAAKGVACRRGEVLLACSASYELQVVAEVRRLELECELIRNRNELMVLPAGITKGTGIDEALNELGISHHNTVGVGDAENDHSLIEATELGYAVANAVPALRAHADDVLSEPDGEGVRALLLGPVLSGQQRLPPRRWRINLGDDEEGAPVSLPASQINVLVAGDTGQGKSYLAGLVAEQLIELGYSLVVIDPEGDHRGLASHRAVTVVGGRGAPLPAPHELLEPIRHSYGSVVVDLSGLDRNEQASYLAELPAEIEAERACCALPQWVLLDEAHAALGRGAPAAELLDPAGKGYCAVTWRPDELAGNVLASFDAVIGLAGPHPSRGLVDVTAAVADLPRAVAAQLLTGSRGSAVLADRHSPEHARVFKIRQRVTPHLRHEHKYCLIGVEPARRFYFRDGTDQLTGAVAGNLIELQAELDRCSGDVLRHHCPSHDFSNWVANVFRDPALAAGLRSAESSMAADSPEAVVQAARVRLVRALQVRWPE
ncbi:MAG TPA: HAD hydrolase family protein [Actinomycetota bacterium]|nr:HAD hydrolase family protein [Actinomycetota bacterium]